MATCVCVRFAWAVCGLAAWTAAQETTLVELRRSTHLPPVVERGRAAVFVDCDGDGDLDLASANPDGRRLFVNDGAGHFVQFAGGLPAPAGEAVALVAGDLDGDGDRDLIVGYADRLDYLLRADGDRFVGAGELPASPAATAVLALLDADGDGDLDVFAGTDVGQDRLLLNDGAGTFSDATGWLPQRSSSPVAVAVVDVDGDRDPDLVLGQQSLTYLLVNDGTGRFTTSSAPTPDPSVGALAVAAADVDGDGDADLLLATRGGVTTRLWLGDGAFGFTDGSAGLPARGAAATYSVLLVDVDQDGDPDAVVGDGDTLVFQPDCAKLWLNDGGGRFIDATAGRLETDEGTTRALVAADVDADADLDLLLVHDELSGAAPELVLNDGFARFAATVRPGMPVDHEDSRCTATGDVDGDGDLDLIVGANRSMFDPQSGVDVLMRFDGQSGLFQRDGGAVPAALVSTRALRLADLDGDGDLDVVAARFGGPSTVLINDGAGVFADETISRLPGSPTQSMDVAVGDVDRDGDPDLVFGEGLLFQVSDRLYLNDGRGFFVDASAWLPGDYGTTSVVLVDVDGDADLDLVRTELQFLGPRRGVMLLRNDGTGRFTDDPAAIVLGGEPAYSAALGDVDQDGDPDLFVGRGSDGVLLHNDGTGRFTRALGGCLPSLQGGARSAAFGDLDRDGALDIVCASVTGVRVFVGDGRGCFLNSTGQWIPSGCSDAEGLEVVDLDDDGDLDVVVARGNGLLGFPDRVLVNRLRAVALPWLPIPGRTFALDVSAAPGRATLFHVAIPLLAPARARVPVPPFGVLGLRPDALMQLDPIYVPPGAGTARTRIAVPADAGLIDAALHAQAVLLHPAGAHLTNVATTVFAK